MFREDLLAIVRPSGSDNRGLSFIDGLQDRGMITIGRARSPATGKTYYVKNGYLDLLRRKTGIHNVANLANLPPGAGRLYEPLWRGGSLTRLTGERFPNQRELKVMSELVHLDRGGTYLDLGCSAGLYTRNMARSLGKRGDVVGVDIAPSMLREAIRLAHANKATPSFVRADVQHLPFTDSAFSGAVCGGTLNELGDPTAALTEVRRVLVPGARIAVMGIMRARGWLGTTLQSVLRMSGLRYFKATEVESLLNETGFDPEPLRTHGPIFFAGATRR